MNPTQYARYLIKSHSIHSKDKEEAKEAALITQGEIIQLLEYINSEDILFPKMMNFHLDVKLLLTTI